VTAGPEQATSAPTTQASGADREGGTAHESHDTSLRGLAGHRDRLALVLLERLYRWRLAVTLTLVGGLAAILRFVRLGYPDSLSFDELYYARESYSILHLGYGGSWKGEHQAFAHGDLSGLATNADKVVHPLVGKYMIGAGIWLFGPTPFGWRFACAVVGTLSVVLVVLIARHLFKSLIWGALAGVLLAIDGQHIVMSRTAVLDIFLSFWVLVAFGLLLLDRRRARATLARKAAADRGRLGLAPGARIPGFSGGLGVRWWRLAAIVALGLATGVKWSGMYFCAALMILSVLWDLVDRRAAGYRRWISTTNVRSILPAFLTTVVVFPLTYLATYWSWFASPQSYGRHWAEAHPGEGVSWLPAPLRSLVHYHQEMLDFHTELTTANGVSHGYQADPYWWIFQWRPTAFFYANATDPEGSGPCGTTNCSSAVTALGHPLIWWAAAAALAYALYRIVVRADMLAATVIVGTLAGWLPWFIFRDRVIFTFYTVAFVPYVVLTLVWALRHLAQPDRLRGGWSRRGTLAVGGFVAVCLVVAGFFLPLWTGQWVPYQYWLVHMWFFGQWI
jgi:dolichyl-phosphate-mannose--protein O-mannosyl transferase